jgi:sarcosine oxidase subunit delta
MLLLTCPVCGLAAGESSFEPGGEAHLARPSAATAQEADASLVRDYLYMRKNPRGPLLELWLCRLGCGKWFCVARDTVSQSVRATYRIGEAGPRHAAPPDTRQ